MRSCVSLFLGVLLAASVSAAPAQAGRCGAADSCHADLSVAGHAEPQPIRVGEQSAYVFKIKDEGPDSALTVKVQTTIPAGLKILGTEVYGGGSCTVSGTFVECQLGDFQPFQSTEVKVKVQGMAVGTYLAKAEVFGYDIVEPSGGNNQVTATLGVFARPGPAGTSSGSSGSTSSGGGGYAIALKAKDPQRILKAGGTTIRTVVAKTGTLRLRGSVRTAKGATIPLVAVSRGVRAGETLDIFLGTTSAAKARIRKAFRGHARLEVNVLVTIGSSKAKIQLHVKI